MKVTDVRTMRLHGPDEQGIGGVPRELTTLLVRVDTDAGVYGIGECPDFPGDREIVAYAREWLLGRDPFRVAEFVRAMFYGALPPQQPQMSRTATVVGPTAWGVSGVEMALVDLCGKALGVPASVLLGGAFRDRVRVYLDRSGVRDVADPEAWREMARRSVEEGFLDFKFDAEWVAVDVAGDPWTRQLRGEQLDRIVERLAVVRAEAGPAAEIMLDGHMSFDLESALRLASALAPLRLRWLEDPIPILNPDALADLRRRSPIPICAGEMFVAEQFRLFIDRDALDFCHPDLLFVGGMHEARKVADHADLHYLPVALHGNGAAVSMLAAAQVAAATPNFVGLECHFAGAPWMGAIVRREGVPLFADGQIPLTDAPGLGFELDPAACERHLAEGETLFL